MWLRSKEGRVAVSTFDQYTWAVRRHVTPLLGAVRLRDLTAGCSTAGSASCARRARRASPAWARRRPAWCARCCRWRWRRRCSVVACTATRSPSPSRRRPTAPGASSAGRSTRPVRSSGRRPITASTAHSICAW
ncbi:MAG: hypothetical protein ACR2MO_03605 [Acidimicrobiales bacterium]